MLDELEDNVVSRVIQAVGLFGDILSLEDTMEPILSVGGPERLQSKTEEDAEEGDESKTKSDGQKEREVEQEGVIEEVKKNGEVEGGESRGDLVETGVSTDDHKAESGEEQSKSVAAGKEGQNSEELQGDTRGSQEQERICQSEMEEDQAEVEEHCKEIGGTGGEDGAKERVLEEEGAEKEEGEMTEKEQNSDEVESSVAEVEELVEEGKEEEGPREMQVEEAGGEDKTDQEVPAGTQDSGSVDGHKETAEGKQYEEEGKDLKLEDENLQKAEEKEEICEKDKGGAEEKTKLDEQVEEKRLADAESKGQSELSVQPGEETTSKDEDDGQHENEGSKMMETEKEAKQVIEHMEQSDEKEKEQQDGSTVETASASGDDERKDTVDADKEDKTEEEIRPEEEEEANGRQEVKGKQQEEKEDEDEKEQMVRVASSPKTGRGRGIEVLEAVPAVEEGSKTHGRHGQDVYPTSLGQHNEVIEKGEENWDDEEEGEEQEDEKEEWPDQTQPAPLSDTDVDSAGDSQETSQQVEAQQLDRRLQAPMTSLPAAGCGVAREPLSGELVPSMEPIKWIYL